MARDRKRARSRRERQRRPGGPSVGNGAKDGAYTAGDRLEPGTPDELTDDPVGGSTDEPTAFARGDDQETGTPPAPLDHASAEVDIANAQSGLGRPGDTTSDREELEGLLGGTGDDRYDEDLDEYNEGGGERMPAALDESEDDARAGLPARREEGGSKLVGFLRGSARELQRVKWPNRKQVAQATGVVLAFVVVAGGYLGLADVVFSRLVDLII